MGTNGILRVVALNLRNGGAPRVKALVAALVAHQPDVVVLGEAYPTGHPQVILEALKRIGLVHQATAESDFPRYPLGVAITSRLPLDAAAQPLTLGPNRQRILEVRLRDVVVCGAYFPLNKPKVEFWREEFLPYARSRLDAPAILVGDWNSGQPYLDEAGSTLHGAREFAQLSEMGWVDAWRSRNPDKREFTWYSAPPYLSGFRLDHAFVSPSLAPRVLNARYDHTTRQSGATDHSAMVVDLDVAP